MESTGHAIAQSDALIAQADSIKALADQRIASTQAKIDAIHALAPRIPELVRAEVSRQMAQEAYRPAGKTGTNIAPRCRCGIRLNDSEVAAGVCLGCHVDVLNRDLAARPSTWMK